MNQSNDLPATGDATVIRTNRLLLRPFCLQDAQAVESLLNDKEIASNTRSVDYPYPKGQATAWIELHQSLWKSAESYVFAICLSETEQVIGGMGLEIDKSDHNAELGFWIGREFWNNGFCSESAIAVLEFGFEQIGLHKIHSHHLTRNPASGRVMEKIGMVREGLLRGHTRKWGIFEDIIIYGMLANDPRP